MYFSTIGVDSFRKIMTNALTYVDKTKFIESIVKKGHPEVSLFTRPRRFGKTLTLSMLAEFFDINRNSANLFKELEIAKNQKLCADWMNQYPVIILSLKQMNNLSYPTAINNFSETIYQICRDHSYLLDSCNINSADQKLIHKYYDREAQKLELRVALKRLCAALNAHWGKEVIVLLDEYDVPLSAAWQHNYYKEMLCFLRDVFGYAFKGNSYLKFAIITGCLRIAKESIFTGVNNFKCFTISQAKYADTFGFTDQEVDHLLTLAECTHKKQAIKAWYDGYLFGENTAIYCPWDVVNYLHVLNADKNCAPQNY